VQHARREAVEVRTALLTERDELPVELDALRQATAELGQELTHVPAAPTAGPEAGLGADEAAETVELRFERPTGSARDRVGAREHRFGQPQYHARRLLPRARDIYRTGTGRLRQTLSASAQHRPPSPNALSGVRDARAA
jgi:hypothetical protein